MAKRPRLVARRKSLGFSQEALAEKLGVDVSTVRRWELGTSSPQPWAWPKIARQLQVSPDQLGELLTSGASLLSVTGVRRVEAADPHRLASSAAQESVRFVEEITGSHVSDGAIDHLRWELSRIAVEYVYTPVSLLFDDLVEARNAIFGLLSRQQRPRHTRDLYVLGGMACLLLAHASQNIGDQRAALAQLRSAWTCADVAQHDALRLWARGTAALINEWSLRHRAAVDLAQEGSRFPASRESRLRLAAIEARAAARMGDKAHATVALARVHAIRDEPVDFDDVTDLGGLLRFPTAKQSYYLGSTYGLLGDYQKSETYAAEAIAAYENGPSTERSYGDEALARLDVVNARLVRGELDGALDAAAPVLALSPKRRIQQFDLAIGQTRVVLAQSTMGDTPDGRALMDELRHFEEETRSNLPAIASTR
ncbi:helix-turn-helix domain-containing protein [Actinokineospora sp. 24-640]